MWPETPILPKPSFSNAQIVDVNSGAGSFSNVLRMRLSLTLTTANTSSPLAHPGQWLSGQVLQPTRLGLSE